MVCTFDLEVDLLPGRRSKWVARGEEGRSGQHAVCDEKYPRIGRPD